MEYNLSESETMTEVATKAFLYSEFGPGLYSIVVQKIEFGDNRAFTRQGHRDRLTLFMHLGSTGIMEGSHKPRRVANKIEADDDNSLKRLLITINRSDEAFEELEDGDRMSPQDTEEIVDEYGVW